MIKFNWNMNKSTSACSKSSVLNLSLFISSNFFASSSRAKYAAHCVGIFSWRVTISELSSTSNLAKIQLTDYGNPQKITMVLFFQTIP